MGYFLPNTFKLFGYPIVWLWAYTLGDDGGMQCFRTL